MKKSVYTILDEKATSIGPLFLASSDSEAERMVTMAVTDGSIMARYPQDFALLRLGDVDTVDGTLTPHHVPVLVHKVDELVRNDA